MSARVAILHGAEHSAGRFSILSVLNFGMLRRRRMSVRRLVRIGKWSLIRDTCVHLADIIAVARNGPTEIVLLLLLCCGRNAKVLLGLMAWIFFQVTRVAAVRA